MKCKNNNFIFVVFNIKGWLMIELQPWTYKNWDIV